MYSVLLVYYSVVWLPILKAEILASVLWHGVTWIQSYARTDCAGSTWCQFGQLPSQRKSGTYLLYEC